MFLYVESLVKRKGARDLARYERGTAAKKRKEENSFRQLQETAMAHEEQGDCSLAEDASLEVQNSPLDTENKDGTAEVDGGTANDSKHVTKQRMSIMTNEHTHTLAYWILSYIG